MATRHSTHPTMARFARPPRRVLDMRLQLYDQTRQYPPVDDQDQTQQPSPRTATSVPTSKFLLASFSP
ncbi:hypothetical protein KSP39_PZI023873 [Platanthera zijinensis]|uniref:Uncharacterized protein n=1 Tax=Platanthera zijinensis TaxID=2320716 RepID=A0AAP0ATP6_9ASPA